MKSILIILTFILVSCGSVTSGKPREGKTVYSYNDVVGKFDLIREQKLIKNKLVTRTQIASSGKVLEKSIVASELGSVKNGKKRLVVLRPTASEFTVWLEGKRYFSRTKINTKLKNLQVQFSSPETASGSESHNFPRSKYFCYYGQIPDCLYHNTLLNQSLDSNKSYDFYVVWESYPYNDEQFSHIGKKLFSKASIKFEGIEKNLLRFIVEVEGQIILYHFSKSLDLVKMAWIAQGITVLPAGMDVSSLDEE